MEEKGLQKANQHLELSDKELDIARAVFHVNQLTPYPLTDLQIADWAKSISELRPDVKVDDIRAAINKMKLGQIEWNTKLGIQNIFKALEGDTDKEKDFLSRL